MTADDTPTHARAPSGVEPQAAAGVSIYLLGRFEVHAGGRCVLDRSWSRRKAQALFKLLAVQAGRALHREQVLDALWPEMEPAAAANNLHKNLHYLRVALAAGGATAPLLSVTGEMVALARDAWIDVDEFGARARRAQTSGADPALYEQALSLYAGDLLPEDIYEDWAAPRREELRALRARLLTELFRLQEARGDTEGAVHSLQQLLHTDPLHEDAHRALMRLHAATGSRHRALRQYQQCRDSLRRELGVDPSPETEALYREVLAGTVPAAAPPAPATGAKPPDRPRTPPCYGRERELELAEDLLEAAAGGRGGTLFVGGVAGIGKTRFAQQVLAMADDLGGLTLAARGYALEASVSYQLARDMLRQALPLITGQGPAAHVAHRSLYLNRLLPDGGIEPAPAIDPALLQLELFDEIAGLFATLPETHRPLVLLFDDLHAADEASIRLLHVLCRRLAQHAVLILCTYQSEEAVGGHPLADLLASLRRERLVREVTLGPLPERAMRLLVEQLFDHRPVEREFVQQIVHQAEGNPLFAGELVHTMVEEGRARFADGRWQGRGGAVFPVPAAVQDLLDRRLQRLGNGARQVAQVAAVLGRTLDYGLLRRTAPLTEAELLDGLDECIAAYILEETADGYRFRHNLLQEAIDARLTRARRQQLHRTAAEALVGRTHGSHEPDAEVIGHHFVQSDEPWRAAPFLQAAGRRAGSVFANDQAAVLYEQAVAVLRAQPAHADAHLLASLLEDLGDVTRRTGDTGRSVPCYEEAVTLLARAGDAEGAVRVRGKAALAHITRGDVDAAMGLLSDTLRAVTEQSPDLVVARTYYLLAQLHWHSGRHREALAAAEQALTAAEASGDASRRAQAYEVLALACHSLGDWQKGIEYELSRTALGLPGFDTEEAFDAHL